MVEVKRSFRRSLEMRQCPGETASVLMLTPWRHNKAVLPLCHNDRPSRVQNCIVQAVCGDLD